MDPEDAAFALRELIRPKFAIPMHYGANPLGKGTPARAAPNAEVGSGSAEGSALCAHEPIWKRPVCIYQECRKPGMANSAACEEERKRREKAIEQHPGF